MSFRYPGASTKTCYTKNRPRRQHGSLKKVIISCSLELENLVDLELLGGFQELLTLSTKTVPKFPTMLMIPKTRPPVLSMVR